MTISPVTGLIIPGSWALAVVKSVLAPYVRWQSIEKLIYGLCTPHISLHMQVLCGQTLSPVAANGELSRTGSAGVGNDAARAPDVKAAL